MRTIIVYTLSIFVFLAISNAANATKYSKQAVESLAEEHALSVYPHHPDENISAQASPIDTRLNLKPCDSELNAETPNLNRFSKNLTVRVKCEDSTPWTLYIPVQIKILTPVLVANQYLNQGDILTNSNTDIVMIEKNRSRNGFIADKKGITGAKTKKQIRPGEAIINKNVCFVCEGEVVTVIANTSGLSVKAAGIALTDGSFGETVRVKNKSSGRIIHGRVSSVGEIKINL
ncbi:flagellar basal body P-ring formation chaperone FlgA [Catenovulum maritimum]|uniref:Flagella basal body P-ring formation protein FlgA n=1 Tax=Catenovulum maritimum TaxID=1513271 RepID=A0A0J8GRY7_9ALTE|nr:flagellar basal body P-ring formation chaperone FlgA [Catenovulum maritimum]KMT65492.1 hypothetical protein XM47_09070 [Catenovulum maritimum]